MMKKMMPLMMIRKITTMQMKQIVDRDDDDDEEDEDEDGDDDDDDDDDNKDLGFHGASVKYGKKV